MGEKKETYVGFKLRTMFLIHWQGIYEYSNLTLSSTLPFNISSDSNLKTITLLIL